MGSRAEPGTDAPPDGAAGDRAVHAWALEEMRPWFHLRHEGRGYADFLTFANENFPYISVLDVRDGAVEVRPKGDPRVRPEEGGQDWLRLRDYAALFARSLSRAPGPLSLSLAICTGDTVDFPAHYPVFALQKTRGAATILIPDVDFANHGYYEDDAADRPFADKLDQVVFCGSSTGTLFTEDDVRHDRGDRLGLARRFLGHADILVRIGMAVQCTTEEGARMLRAKPYFAAIPWAEQLGRRYILSVDGNGATCSRVVLTLRSQSLLLKYRSNERLFYFHGLAPWVHYVPVEGADDLEAKLAALRSGAIDAPRIVRNANAFFAENLRRASVEAYVLRLVQLFASGYVADLVHA